MRGAFSAQLRAELLICRICGTCCGGIQPTKLAGRGHDGMSGRALPPRSCPCKVYNNGCSNTTVHNHHWRYREHHGPICSSWLGNYTLLRCNQDADDLEASALSWDVDPTHSRSHHRCADRHSESLELGCASTCRATGSVHFFKHSSGLGFCRMLANQLY